MTEREIASTSVDELDLKPRAHGCMDRLGITTVGELLGYTPEELMAMPNFGEVSLQSVEEELHKLGIVWPEPEQPKDYINGSVEKKADRAINLAGRMAGTVGYLVFVIALVVTKMGGNEFADVSPEAAMLGIASVGLMALFNSWE